MTQEDLFNQASTAAPIGPLAHRRRPRTLADFVGQEHLLGEAKPLRQWLARGQIPSLVLWGPPGVGKTTLARLIASTLGRRWVTLSAVEAGVKDIRAQFVPGNLLFIDEIHRLNRAQQDILLPAVESGLVTLIGATTENPSFELNSALLSRCRVLTLKALSIEEIQTVLKRVCDQETWPVDPQVLTYLAAASQGDARKALASLELAQSSGLLGHFDENRLRTVLDTPMPRYDSGGEEHHNVTSALIKSIRDSDPNAGLYYLARMIEGGEDPMFIARRLVILAAEDVGLADPQALVLAVAMQQAVHAIGLPEARIPLAEAVVYLARAPKSNESYAGINQAIEEVKKTGALPVPMHLRNAANGWMRRQGYGRGYVYAHESPELAQRQTHLPDGVSTREFLKKR